MCMKTTAWETSYELLGSQSQETLATTPCCLVAFMVDCAGRSQSEWHTGMDMDNGIGVFNEGSARTLV
jgi:hypothetical protein